DITEYPTCEEKVYCAVVLDVFSRRVVGWSIDASPTAALVTNALGMAIDQRVPLDGAVIHSDHGTQFTSWAFTNVRLRLGSCRRWARSAIASTTPSSSRSGAACRSNCWTARGGGPVSSWPMRSSSTWRSF